MLGLAVGGAWGCPGQAGRAAPGAPEASTRQRSGTVGERGGGPWKQAGGCALHVERPRVEEAAPWRPLQPCGGEWEPCWSTGTLQGHLLSQPPLPVAPVSAPGTLGACGRGAPRLRGDLLCRQGGLGNWGGGSV